MASIFKDSAHQAIQDQSPLLRYKGSFLIIATGLVWIIGELAKSPDLTELGWGPALGIVATLAAFLLNRFTRDGITPSMARRLEQSGAKAHLDRPSVTAPLAAEYVGRRRAPDTVDLPVYDGPTTAGE